MEDLGESKVQYTSLASRDEVGGGLIGLPATSAYSHVIARIPEIKQVSLIQYRQPAPLESREGISDNDRKVVLKARQLKAELGVSFWECLALVVREGGEISEPLISGSTYH